MINASPCGGWGRADLEAIAERYAGGEALIEATTNYFYIYDLLSEYLDVVVGHPPKLLDLHSSKLAHVGSGIFYAIWL